MKDLFADLLFFFIYDLHQLKEVMASPMKFSTHVFFLSTLFGKTIENRELLYVKYYG